MLIELCVSCYRVLHFSVITGNVVNSEINFNAITGDVVCSEKYFNAITSMYVVCKEKYFNAITGMWYTVRYTLVQSFRMWCAERNTLL